jgi:hypothetical protein
VSQSASLGSVTLSEFASGSLTAVSRVVGDDPHLAAPAVLDERRLRVRVDAGLVRVRVVDAVVPDDPEARRDHERQKPCPAERVPGAPTAHDGSVQGLVRDERQPGEARADENREDERDGPAAPAERDRRRRERDDGEVDGHPASRERAGANAPAGSSALSSRT